MTDEERLRQVEMAVATMATKLDGHVAYCEGRMRVLWKLAALLAGTVALVVSGGIALLRP